MKFDKKSRLARLQMEHQEDERREQGGTSRKWVISEEALEKANLTDWRPKEGKNFVQFLPASDPDNKHSIGMELWFHRNVGPDNDNFLCLRKMFGKPCPICEEFGRRRDEDWNAIKHLAAGRYPTAWLYLIVDVDSDETVAEGVRTYVACKTVRDEVINVCDPRTGEARFLPNDPEEARVFCFTRTGTGKEDTKYSHFSYLDERAELPEEFYKELPQFEDLLNVPTYDEVNMAFKGGLELGEGAKLELDDKKADTPALKEEGKKTFGRRVPAVEKTRKTTVVEKDEPDEPDADDEANYDMADAEEKAARPEVKTRKYRRRG